MSVRLVTVPMLESYWRLGLILTNIKMSSVRLLCTRLLGRVTMKW